MPDYETLLVSRDGAVDWLTLNSGDRFNTLTSGVIGELHDYFHGLRKTHSVRVVVLQGSSADFCAGLNIKSPLPVLHASAPEALQFMEAFGELIIEMRRCPQPIVALLKGAVSGGGMALAVASDIRIAAASMHMNSAFMRIGLSGMEMGLSYLLPRLIGAASASDILLTGRRLDASESQRLGLVSRVVADDALEETGRSIVTQMLQSTAFGLRLTKETLHCALNAASLESAIALENRNQALCFQSGSPVEGIAAFKEKRPPAFDQIAARKK